VTDVFSIVADALAKLKPANVAPDSFSFLPDFKEKRRETERSVVIDHTSGGIFVGRVGDWKLVSGHRLRKSPATQRVILRSLQRAIQRCRN